MEEQSNANELLLKHIGVLSANQCNIEFDEILETTRMEHIVKCRWLWWFAYRYLTNSSYRKIASDFHKSGIKFTPAAIAIGTYKMTRLISDEPIWGKRWKNLKCLVKQYNKDEDYVDETLAKKTINIVITKPKNIDINIEYKEGKI